MSNSTTTSESIQIRSATLDEVDQLCDFAKKTFRIAYQDSIEAELLENFTNTHFDTAKVISEIQSDDITFFLSIENDEILAYSKVIRRNKPDYFGNENHLFIEKIYVSPDIQKSGLGKAQITFISGFAKDENLKSIWLKVWEGNLKAQAFYKKLGFSKIGDAPFQMEHRRFNDHVLELKL
ncbi:MAG: GNAT family N-acetyltransferase [Bacteroidota bacterium]